jgi:lipopolysaccharide/colanic/teichoic acid biosynthesis glycosyltransferase
METTSMETAYRSKAGERMYELTKRAMDVFISALLLFGLMPFMLVVAALIKLDSPGPVVLRQKRVGRGLKLFDCFKFRTMVENAQALQAELVSLNEMDGPVFKIRNDPRITRIGKYLRKYSIDELPQLFNVLAGHMSLVGPRMISPAELEKYGKWGMNLLTIPPGITGLWQVSGRADLSYEERVQLDMSYIRNYTIWLDLQILWRTIPAVLQCRGAY